MKLSSILEAKSQSDEEIEEVTNVLKRYDENFKDRLSGLSKQAIRRLV